LFAKEDLKKIKLEKNIESIDEVKTNFNFKKEKIEHKTSKISEKNDSKNISTNSSQNNF
jgi:hypothetical protein